jgi:hypothetical protein
MNIAQNRDQAFDLWYNVGCFEANRQGSDNTYAEEPSRDWKWNRLTEAAGEKWKL